MSQINKKFDKLTIIEVVGRYDKNQENIYKAVCDCGGQRVGRIGSLKRSR